MTLAEAHSGCHHQQQTVDGLLAAHLIGLMHYFSDERQTILLYLQLKPKDDSRETRSKYGSVDQYMKRSPLRARTRPFPK